MTQEDRSPVDARYCPSCGEPLPEEHTRFYEDVLLDVYRAPFFCPSCSYHGEVVRHGGLEDYGERDFDDYFGPEKA